MYYKKRELYIVKTMKIVYNLNVKKHAKFDK